MNHPPAKVRGALAALALLLSLDAATAYADRAAEARFHDEVARRHYAARRYEDAVRSFMLEQRLAPNPNIVFNIALCFQQLGRHADAYMYYAEYLASDDDDEGRRGQAEQALASLRPRVALVTVNSEPPGMQIYVDRRELGQYGVTPRVLALDAGEHRIWVERPGYRADEQTVELDLAGAAEVTLHPEQILGRLVITSPTPAQVRIVDPDGAVVAEGETPFDQAIAPGTFRAEAMSGDERWSEPVVVRAEQTSEVRAALTGPTGAATVTANVVGALVLLDGDEQGFTPQVLPQIPIGEHRLEVRADGMSAYEGALDVQEDDHSYVTIDLSPQQAEGISPATWTVGALAIAAAIGAGITTGIAADRHDRFRQLRMNNQPTGGLADESQTLNIAADALWLTAGLAAVTAVILLLTTSEFEAQPSRASVSRGQR